MDNYTLRYLRVLLSGNERDNTKLSISDDADKIDSLCDVSEYMDMFYRNIKIKDSGNARGVKRIDVSISNGWSGKWADRVKFEFFDEPYDSKPYNPFYISHGFGFSKYWCLKGYIDELHNDMIYIENLNLALAFFFSHKIKYMTEVLKDQTKKINDAYEHINKSIDFKNAQYDYKNKMCRESKTYIIKDENTGLYKIGRSVDPMNREKTLQSEKPTIKMIKVFKKNIESDLHREFADVRVRGEWFKLNKIQLKRICTQYE